MPKCQICGKKFETLSDLREHHRAIHPNARFVAPKTGLTRNILVSIIVILVAGSSLAGYLAYVQSQRQNSVSSDLLGTPISPALNQNLSTVSFSTLGAIGLNQSGTTAPTPISGGQSHQLLLNNKPEILYIGAEFCPYCAAERWSLIVALSKFGNFSGLSYMLSSSSDTFRNTATFSFYGANYTSQYISFVAVEHQDRNYNPLQATTTEEKSLWDNYTGGQEIYPFIYIDSQYYLAASQYSPGSLSNLNWMQIGSQLNNPNSPVAKLIDGSANQLIGAICSALQAGSWPTPAELCNQSFAALSFRDNPYALPSSPLNFNVAQIERNRIKLTEIN